MEQTDGGQDRKLRHDKEIDQLRELRSRQPATQQEFAFQGVLLSDAIEDCVSSFGLITPFKRENLKSASYKLRIGDEYSIDGKIIPLVDEPGRNRIIIPPFAVAIIKTLEIVNMPRFLIGRWNIQVSKAYEGLVWVGGPQVDPGYVGYLFCPIYNFRDKPVELTMGKPIAVIDFVTTTPVGPRSKAYPFPPDRVLFEDYEPQTLISGIAKTYEEVRQNNRSTGKQLEQVATRIDNFVLITFTIIAVLFAAVTIFVTRAEQVSLWNPALFLVSLTAIFISVSAWMKSDFRGRSFRNLVQAIVVLFLLFATAYHIWNITPVQQQINDLRKDVDSLKKEKSTSSPSALPPTTSEPASTGRKSSDQQTNPAGVVPKTGEKK